MTMNLNDIAVDCETLSLRHDAAVIAIGARAFDRTTGKLGQTHYVEIDFDSAAKHNHVMGSTVRWWIAQSPRAKTLFAEGERPSVATALQNFSDWMRSVGKGVPRIWANGIQQDVCWLVRLYEVAGHGLTMPWHYNNARDVRTIIEAAEDIAGFNRSDIPSDGTHHNALDDATWNAHAVSLAWKALRQPVPQAKVTSKPTTTAPVKVDDDDEL